MTEQTRTKPGAIAGQLKFEPVTVGDMAFDKPQVKFKETSVYATQVQNALALASGGGLRVECPAGVKAEKVKQAIKQAIKKAGPEAQAWLQVGFIGGRLHIVKRKVASA